MVAISLNIPDWFHSWLPLAVSVPLSVVVGYLYGLMLNRIKGQEMLVGTYVGFSIVSGMCIFGCWPRSKARRWSGLMGARDCAPRSFYNPATTILNNFLMFKLGEVEVPTGLLLFFALFCLLLWLFDRSKSGIAMRGRKQPRFAHRAV